jgi:hypothetical protein
MSSFGYEKQTCHTYTTRVRQFIFKVIKYTKLYSIDYIMNYALAYSKTNEPPFWQNQEFCLIHHNQYNSSANIPNNILQHKLAI